MKRYKHERHHHHTDDDVIELALQKYECYHAMELGTATYAMVHNTSAGILGWANTTIAEDVNITNLYDACNSVRENRRLAPYWCKICSCDCGTSTDHEHHLEGYRHQVNAEKFGLLEQQQHNQQHHGEKTTESSSSNNNTQQKRRRYFWCSLCDKHFDGKEALQYHRDFDEDHLLRNAQLNAQSFNTEPRGVDFLADDDGDDEDEDYENAIKQAMALSLGYPTQAAAATAALAGAAVVDNDVDYSQFHDAERMQQTTYDDVVVELALYNYEAYLGLERGSATYAMVNDTPDGILGWASSTVRDVVPDTQEQQCHDENAEEEEDFKLASVVNKRSQENTNEEHKEEEEEEDCKPAAFVGTRTASPYSADSSSSNAAVGDDDAVVAIKSQEGKAHHKEEGRKSATAAAAASPGKSSNAPAAAAALSAAMPDHRPPLHPGKQGLG